jgi:ligand-binding sensor domain-containing protein
MKCLPPTFRRAALRLLCLSWCLTMAQMSSGQSYSFKHYGHDEGLNTTVNRLLQDRLGFLWVGTGNGLFRYDGQRFQRFGIPEGLPSVSIRDMHESSDGTLWIVTSAGLARLSHNHFERVKTGLVDGPE